MIFKYLKHYIYSIINRLIISYEKIKTFLSWPSFLSWHYYQSNYIAGQTQLEILYYSVVAFRIKEMAIFAESTDYFHTVNYKWFKSYQKKFNFINYFKLLPIS